MPERSIDLNHADALVGLWRLPLTSFQQIIISRRTVNPNGSVEAFFEVRDAEGELVRAGFVVAAPREPLLLLGAEKLNVDHRAEVGIVRTILDPRQYPAVLAEAIDPGPSVPPPPALTPSAELLLRVAELAHRAGGKDEYERGYLAGYMAGRAEGPKEVRRA